jgi:hypothetical protein
MTTLIATAKLNDVDPLAWLADVLARIAGIPQSRLPELLPWQWKKDQPGSAGCVSHGGNLLRLHDPPCCADSRPR